THNEELLQFVDRIVGIRDGHLVDVEHPGLRPPEELAVEVVERSQAAPVAEPVALHPEGGDDDLRSKFGPQS
ncbi:MAG: hypothetical protein ABI571_07375, partial [Actinomycetota bacterium]